jgi:hypothetical protein
VTQCLMPQESGKEDQARACRGERLASLIGPRESRTEEDSRFRPSDRLLPAPKCAISTKRLCVLTPGAVALLNGIADP